MKTIEWSTATIITILMFGMILFNTNFGYAADSVTYQGPQPLTGQEFNNVGFHYIGTSGDTKIYVGDVDTQRGDIRAKVKFVTKGKGFIDATYLFDTKTNKFSCPFSAEFDGNGKLTRVSNGSTGYKPVKEGTVSGVILKVVKIVVDLQNNGIPVPWDSIK